MFNECHEKKKILKFILYGNYVSMTTQTFQNKFYCFVN